MDIDETMNGELANARELLESVLEVLEQGEALLTGLTDDDYTRVVPPAFNASIGGHYRHCLDHFRSLIQAAEQGDLNYDQRERSPLIESDRFAALNATRELHDAYTRLDLSLLARPLRVTCKARHAGVHSQTAFSTLGREVMYAAAHAGHHYALIAILCAMAGQCAPPDFGMAPSTLRHRRGSGGEATAVRQNAGESLLPTRRS